MEALLGQGIVLEDLGVLEDCLGQDDQAMRLAEEDAGRETVDDDLVNGTGVLA